MIITQLNGGLGNQMFQYAIGRKLSLLHRTDLKLDISWFKSDLSATTPRLYELHHFRLPATIATDEDRVRILYPWGTGIAGKLYARFNARLPYYKRTVVAEKSFPFDLNILKAPDNIFLSGYWQTEQYFLDIRETLLQDFHFAGPLTGTNADTANTIVSSESVSVHVRRADYVSNKKINNVHGVCPLEYYEKALCLVTEKVNHPVFFIFSDDMDWCRKNLKIGLDKYYIEQNTGTNSYLDMQLMSLCKHHIIANSSFSWWGAWLNRNEHKTVIAPAKWFNDASFDTRSLIPSTWRKL